jgi:hypothetical protein
MSISEAIQERDGNAVMLETKSFCQPHNTSRSTSENGTKSLKLVEETGMSAAEVGCWSNTWQSADSTIMKKWKWLFVIGCKHKSPISTKKEFFKLVTRWNKCIIVLGDYAEH